MFHRAGFFAVRHGKTGSSPMPVWRRLSQPCMNQITVQRTNAVLHLKIKKRIGREHPAGSLLEGCNRAQPIGLHPQRLDFLQPALRLHDRARGIGDQFGRDGNRRVRLHDLIHSDMPPPARGVIDNDEMRRLTGEFGDIPTALLQLLAASRLSWMGRIGGMRRMGARACGFLPGLEGFRAGRKSLPPR